MPSSAPASPGIACALEARKRGHDVTLFDADERIGGQLWLASRIPGKADYLRAIQGFEAQLVAAGVRIELGRRIGADELIADGFDEVVVSTGIEPRPLDIPGADSPRVVGYTEILNGSAVAGPRVAIIGGGGIGHDVALFLAHPGSGSDEDIDGFKTQWGIDRPRAPQAGAREIVMLKRSDGRFGGTLGKSTGWIVRRELRDYGVTQLANVTYERIEEDGIRILCNGEPRTIAADTIVVCAGQLSQSRLADDLNRAGKNFHVIGGARLAGELDAKRAIEEGTRLGLSL